MNAENIQCFGLKYEEINQEFGSRTVKNMVTIPSMKALERYMRDNESKGREFSKSSEGTGDWYGTEDMNEWYDVMKFGDDKIIKKIKKAKENSMQQLGGYSPKGYMFDVEGEFFDIGEVLSNKPECWLNPILDEEVKEITLKISTSANQSVSSESIIKGAGEILGIVAKLESDGYKVRVENLLFSQEVSYNGDDLLTKIVVKDYNDNINFSKMSAIVSPSLQRRGSFQLKERLFEDELSGSYGQTKQLDGVTTVYNKDAMTALKDKLFKKDK